MAQDARSDETGAQSAKGNGEGDAEYGIFVIVAGAVAGRSEPQFVQNDCRFTIAE